MSLQDPVSDMLTSIRNAQAVGHVTTSTPYSRYKSDVLRVLKQEGYILGFEHQELAGVKSELLVRLKYFHGRAVIEELQRISKPSVRVYRGAKDLPKVRGGLGIAILSTPKGVMSDREARLAGLGGEVICLVA